MADRKGKKMKDMMQDDDLPKFIRSRGMKFPYDPRVINPRKRRMLRRGEYEKREVEAVKSLVRPEDVVIELGAGMGYMSTFMTANLGVREVHAFEANPAMIPYIHDAHTANDVQNVTVHNALLGPRKGSAKFYVRENFVASSMQENPKGEKSPVTSVETIEVRNIKQAFRDIKPTVLVCDIEGAEAALLPAADLSGLRAAVVELHPQWIGEAGVRAVFDAMHGAGLTYYPLLSDKKVVTFRKDWRA